MKKISGIYWIFLALCFAYCSDATESTETPSSQTKAAKGDATGEELAQIFCAACHQFPAPSLLDQETWKNFVLLRMGAFMGIYEHQQEYVSTLPSEWLEPGIGGQRVSAAKIYPAKPTLSIADWGKIKKYYLEQAPQALPKAANKKEIQVGIPFFESRSFDKEKVLAAQIQGIGLDPIKKQVYFSIHQGGIYRVNYQGVVRSFSPGNTFVSQINTDAKHFTTLDMGTRLASDAPKGRLLKSLSFLNHRKKQSLFALDGLMRPVHFSVADLNGDQKEDYIISEYGNLLGQLAWYEIKADGTSIPHVLNPEDGAIATQVLDFNKDGHPDLFALQANADEGIDLYLNDGQGNFSKERKLRFPPSYGSTHFEVVDFNQDGAEDLLVCHGDNGDYTPLLKPYHGVRLYLQKKGKFEEAFFLPLHGAYQASAQDFDLDGDLDIAVVSFHPDFAEAPQESFVLFINDGQEDFSAYTVPQYADARWMRFACTDIDGDQDIDILLTAFNVQTPDVPKAAVAKWVAADEAVLLLENKTRSSY